MTIRKRMVARAPRLLASLLLLCLLSTSANAALTLPALFSDRMVLLRSAQTPIWGKADAGQTVHVTLNNSRTVTQANEDGRWQASLDLTRTGDGPFVMVVEIPGAERKIIKDVLVGEVWLASGQSNMAFELRNCDISPDEIAASANPRLREFRVRGPLRQSPVDDCNGSWVEASPETVGTFSGVGWYFGRQIQERTNAPVGIIHVAVGGTAVEAWLSTETMAADPVLAEGSARALDEYTNTARFVAEFADAFSAWLKNNDRELPEATRAAVFGNTSNTGYSTTTVTENLPTDTQPAPQWTSARVPGFRFPAAGVGWLRKEVVVPEHHVGKPWPIALHFGHGYAETYWDGERVGQTTHHDAPGVPIHTIPAARMTAGKHTLAIRVFSPTHASITHQISDRMRYGEDPHNFIGEWQFSEEVRFPALTREELAKAPQAIKPLFPTNAPGVLFNSFINPVVPYAIRGVIWYQGESNIHRSAQYAHTFALLIEDWRIRWGRGDIPFYFCQLAAFGEKTAQPGRSLWAELREAQTSTLKLPQTGMAVLIDAGESADIHPRNKKDVGERLAALALKHTYLQPGVSQGPLYESATIEGNRIRIRFSNTGAGLVARPVAETYPVRTLKNDTAPLKRNSPASQLEGFAICGADGKWVWADAQIDGDSVVVSAASVPSPTDVRYGWADNPTCNLYNKEGFPASPFRTDSQPRLSENGRYGFNGQR